MSQAEQDSSPYTGLVNLCYQLRHEKESVSTALMAKGEVVLNLENQVIQLKMQLSDLTSSHRAQLDEIRSEEMKLQDERLILTQKLSELEDRYRKLETRENQAREQADQFEEMIRSLKEQKKHSQTTSSSHALAEMDVKMNKLDVENKRLKKELNTFKVLYKNALKSKRSNDSTEPEGESVKRICDETREPRYMLSASDSLLREFETIMGWSLVKEQATGAIDLVCNSNNEVVVRLFVREDGQVEILGDENDDSPSSTFLRTFNSIPGYVAKKTLEELTKRVIRDIQ